MMKSDFRKQRILQINPRNLDSSILLGDSFTMLGLFISPSQSSKSFGKNRMRVMITGIHPISVHGTQILDLKFDQGFSKIRRVTKTLGEVVYKTLKTTVERISRNIPAWNSNFRLKMFIPNLTKVSIGARASEKSRKPTMIGNSL